MQNTRHDELPVHARPCAGPGLISYRYRHNGSWIMIGATDHRDALIELMADMDPGDWQQVHPDNLQIWNGQKYIQSHA